MFTGIIEEKGIVKSITLRGESGFLEIQCQKVLEDTKLGDSIAVNQFGAGRFHSRCYGRNLTPYFVERVEEGLFCQFGTRIADRTPTGGPYGKRSRGWYWYHS